MRKWVRRMGVEVQEKRGKENKVENNNFYFVSYSIIFLRELPSNKSQVCLCLMESWFDLQASMKRGKLLRVSGCAGMPRICLEYTFTNRKYSSTFLPTPRSFTEICRTTCSASMMKEPLKLTPASERTP